MMARRRLHDRRVAESWSFTVGGLAYVATVGRYDDGSIGELFLLKSQSEQPGRHQREMLRSPLALRFNTVPIPM